MKRISLLIIAASMSIGMFAETFVKVTDASTLKDGDKVVLGNAANERVSAGFMSNKETLTTATASFTGDKATLDKPTYLTLKKSGNNWKFFLGDKPIGHPATTNKFDTKQKTETEFAISFNNDGSANIVSQTTSSYAFYYNATSPRFGLYGSSAKQSAIELYKLDEGTVPPVVVTSVSINKESTEIRVNKTETLTATILPNDAVDKSIQWGSTNEQVVAVDNSGTITGIAVGTAKVWVKAKAVEGVSDTCVVTVLPAAAEGNATYNAVQKADYLTEGAKVFIGTIKSGKDYVMGQYESGRNIKGTAATYGDGRHSVTAPQQVAYTVHFEDGKYVFVDHDGKYLICDGDSRLISSSTNDNKAKWTLGAFDEDDATVTLTNVYYSSYGIFYNWQGNNLFSAYGGVGDGSNLAKIILYSDQAPEWVERVKDPWMQAESTTIEWGQCLPVEGYTHYWSQAEYVRLTMNDLPANIDVELTNDANGAFTCYTSTISANKTSEQFLISWSVEQTGKYEGELMLTCQGLTPIKIKLIAEAIDSSTNPEYLPSFTASVDEIVMNLNEENEFSDIQSFTFSATNLEKTLHCKWENDGNTLFQYANQNDYMEIMVGDYEIYLNSTLQPDMEAGQDYEDVEVIMMVDKGLTADDAGQYQSQLHFYSYKQGSKEEKSIDVIIPIKVNVQSMPSSIDMQKSDVVSRKVLREGILMIERGGKRFNVLGAEL